MQGAETYVNVYGRLTCSADALVQPSSTAELANALKQFAAASAGKPLKIRTARKTFHSSATFPCPFTSDVMTQPPAGSSAAPSTVAVMLQDFNQILAVDAAARVVRVQAGLQVIQLLRWAEKHGMATEIGAPTNYGDLTIGGVISANGHGTGANVSDSMACITRSFTWVDSSGNVHVSARDSAEGRGLAGGVGLIGIITEVELQMTPPSKTQAVSINFLPDATMAADVQKYLKVTPNIALMWRPDQGKYNAFLMSPTHLPPKIVDDQAGLVFPLPTIMSNAFQLVLLPLQADINDTAVSRAFNPMNCIGAATSLAYLKWAGKPIMPNVPGAPLAASIAQVHAVGSTNKIMSGGCEPFCVWNSELTVDEVAFAIELDQLEAWAADVKKIVDEDLHEGGAAKDRCLPFGGYVFIRFGRGSADNTGTTSGMRMPVFVELTWIKSRKLPEAPGKYSFVQDIIEQLTLCKYRGRPHWGKNYDRTFTHPDCPVRDLYAGGFDKQLELQEKYDPEKRFEPLLMTQIIGRIPNLYAPRCALRHQCHCTADEHCAEGHACVAARSFPMNIQ